jgi:hypothetical protein
MRLDVPEFVRDIVPREGEEAVRLARACNRSNPVINERSGVLRKKRRNHTKSSSIRRMETGTFSETGQNFHLNRKHRVMEED